MLDAISYADPEARMGRPGKEVPMKSAFCLTATAAILLCIVPAQAQTLRSASPDARFDTLRPESGFQDWRRLSLEGGARPTDAGAGYA